MQTNPTFIAGRHAPNVLPKTLSIYLFRSQPNLEDEIHFKWGRFVTSQKSNKSKSHAKIFFFQKLFIVELKIRLKP